MEGLVNPEPRTWAGSSVFISGHTGFKGSWLAMWLRSLGASVHGFALAPPSTPSLFDVARLSSVFSTDTRGDLADLELLRGSMSAAHPSVIFHLAAQPLVLESYRDPLGTLTTNAMGTAHVLDAARGVPSVRAIVIVTTDKVYAPASRAHGEADPLGGNDVYSGSKAAAEIIAGAFRSSFFSPSGSHPARVATARAGNVVGGGDWAADRLIPDCVKAFEADLPVKLRHPESVRPWQHVLEPLSGYLVLAEKLMGENGDRFAKGWNFGPDPGAQATVAKVASMCAEEWGGRARVEVVEAQRSVETHSLILDSSAARRELAWAPRWSLSEAIKRSVAWHRSFALGHDMLQISIEEIHAYEAAGS